MIAIIEGEELAKEECRYQFRNHRWNCARFPPGVELFPKNHTGTCYILIALLFK